MTFYHPDAGGFPGFPAPTVPKMVMHDDSPAGSLSWAASSGPAIQRGTSSEVHNRLQYMRTTSQTQTLNLNDTIHNFHPYIQQSHYGEDHSREGPYQQSGSLFLENEYPALGEGGRFLGPEGPLDFGGGSSWPLTEGNDASPTTTTSSRAPAYNPSLESESRNSKPRKKQVVCYVLDCNKVFGRTAELSRHVNSVHRGSLREPPALHPCPHEGCPRRGEKGFKRVDNLKQHLRGPHGQQLPKGRRAKEPTFAKEHPPFD